MWWSDIVVFCCLALFCCFDCCKLINSVGLRVGLMVCCFDCAFDLPLLVAVGCGLVCCVLVGCVVYLYFDLVGLNFVWWLLVY